MGLNALGTGLASAGLATQGWNAAEMDQQRVQQGRQATELGQMGLEEATIARDLGRATRKTAADAYSAGKTMGQTYDQIAETYMQNGRPDMAQQVMDMAQTLRQKGITRAAMAYMNGHTDAPGAPPSAPVPRPDLAQYIDGIDQNAISADNRGNIYFADPKTGQRVSLNAGRLLELEGVIKPPKLETIPAGGMGVLTGQGIDPSRPENQISAPKTYPPQAHTVKTYNSEGQVVGEKLVDETGKEISTSGQATGTGDANVRKDLAVLNDITKGITELGEEYGKTDMSNPLNPRITLTPKGQQVAMVAEQIRLANQELAPRTVIELATKGKPMWKMENGQRTGVLLYQGQEFPLSTPSGGAVPPRVPTATPVAPPPAAIPQPAARPTSPPAGLEGAGGKPINVTPEDYRNAEAARETRRAKREAAEAAQRAERKKRQEANLRGVDKINELYRRPGYNKGGKVQRYGL